ncbi:MAG: hypothetical protein HYW63_05095 [Candidatus Levybacteria bacterium]|nr:hypothetical protein [Candidatus Levybacteria bacterium]
MKTVPICIFCGSPADTREHIPAKQFFKGTPDMNLITVPSCKNCNKGFQKDEDFFRQFNAGFLMDRSERAKELMENQITRSIKRKPALAHQMFSQMHLVDAYTKSKKVYIGKATAYHITASDTKRINRIVRKIIEGLFFHEFKQILPKDWVVRIVWVNPKVEKELGLIELAKTLKWRVIKEDTFAYGVDFVPETHQSIWLIDFFKVSLFYLLVLDRKTAK